MGVFYFFYQLLLKLFVPALITGAVAVIVSLHSRLPLNAAVF